MVSSWVRSSARFEFGLWWATLERFSAALGELDGFLVLVEMVCQVAHAGENVRTEPAVATDLYEVERAVEVLLRRHRDQRRAPSSRPSRSTLRLR